MNTYSIFLFDRDTWLLIDVHEYTEDVLKGYIENGAWYIIYNLKTKSLVCHADYLYSGKPIYVCNAELIWEIEYDKEVCQAWCGAKLNTTRLGYNEIIEWGKSCLQND